MGEDHLKVSGAVGGQTRAHVGGHGVGHVAKDGERRGAFVLQVGQDRVGQAARSDGQARVSAPVVM